MIQVETMLAADLTPCAQLVGQSVLMRRYGYAEESARRDLGIALEAGHDELLVARGESRQLLGFGWLVPRGAFARSAYLKLILIDEAARGRGVGRALIESLEARYLDPAGLVMLCSADNEQAQRFYQKLGYGRVGRIPDYTGAGRDEVIFFKPSPRLKAGDRPAKRR